jgi:hypothetical protein
MTISTVAEALKAAKAAASAPEVITTTEVTESVANVEGSEVTPKKKRVSKPKEVKTKTPKEVKTKMPKMKVDQAWLDTLAVKVNEHFSKELIESIYVKEHGTATITFAVAKNKGTPVSLTPRIVYSDGAIQSPGPQCRLGFCTDQNFEDWFKKMRSKLDIAFSRKPRVKGKTTTRTSCWGNMPETVKDGLGDNYVIKTTGSRLVIHSVVDGKNELIAAFKHIGESVHLTSARGPIKIINDILHLMN